MSDMLEKLLGVEKTAAGLVAAAETEAGQRTSDARLSAQKAHTELLKRMALENEAAVSAARERIGAERARKNKEYKDGLARRRADAAAFKGTVLSLIGKEGQ